MKKFLKAFSKIFKNKRNNVNQAHHQADDYSHDNNIETLSIKMKNYIKKIKTIYANILDYLENDQSNDDMQNSNITFSFQNDMYGLKLFLTLITKIADNHNRSSDLIEKIESILKSMKADIQNNFTNDQIFNIFKANKKLLLFLFKEEIIIPNKHIFNIMNSDKYEIRNYPLYFYPEFKSFFTDELIEKYKINEIDFNEFDNKRKIGENEYYISRLISHDLIEEFIIYITSKSISLNSTIKSSIFETNEFLINKTPTFLEYAAFFGSIQIFQYLKFNNIELTPSLWLYAIHGKNPEIIHLLEENEILPISYKECILESIKCHHNEIKNYFQINYNNETKDLDSDVLIKSIKCYNFTEFSKNSMKNSNIFYYLCKYDYFEIVKLLLADKNNLIDINLQKQTNNKKDCYDKTVKKLYSYQDFKFEKIYNGFKTPLIAAIENGNKEIAAILLQQNNINTHIKFKSDFSIYKDGKYTYIHGGDLKSILFIAAERGYSEIVQLLIHRKDININEESEINGINTSKKLTALHIAITNEHVETVKILLNEKNININCIESDTIDFTDCYVKTPLNIAIEKGNSQIAQLLISNKNTDLNRFYYNYIHIHVCDGDSYDRPEQKLTPLQMAIKKENKIITQSLLETKKININEVGFLRLQGIGRGNDKINETALHIAVEKNNFDIVEKLLSYEGIDVNYVANYKHKVEKLYGRYSCIDIKTEQKTALSIAVENENLKIIESLLNNQSINKNIELTITKIEYSKDLEKHQTIEKINALDIAIKKGNNTIINFFNSIK